MRSLSHWIIALCASPFGVVVLAALDSTLFFSLPFGIDAAVIILAAQLETTLVDRADSRDRRIGRRRRAHLLDGRQGRRAGARALGGAAPPRAHSPQGAEETPQGAIALAVLDLIPPPFPFTPFVLAAGALEVKTRMFFGTLIACRLLRFGAEAALAATYGQGVMRMLDSDLFHQVVLFFVALAIVLTILSLAQIIRTTRKPAAT